MQNLPQKSSGQESIEIKLYTPFSKLYGINALSPFLLELSLEYSIRKVQENIDRRELNETRRKIQI